MDESASTMSLGDSNSDDSLLVDKTKPKKRSLVERELETNLTEKITSPVTTSDGTSTSRYGRALRLKTDTDFCDTDKTVAKMIKSPKFDKTPVKLQSPVYKMHASNSPLRGSPKICISQSPNTGMSLASSIDDQLENIYNENLSLSRFASNDKFEKDTLTKKSTKIYIRKDLIQSREKEETITLIKNMISPVKSAYKSPKTHVGNILERSADKYSLNSKSQNGYLDTSSVVKTLDFDGNKKKNKDSKEKVKAVPTKSEIFEMEAKCDYQVGDLAWARIGTYPFWPCIVTRDPLSGTFVKKKLFGRIERDVIHVTFFGDNGRRGWIVDNMLRKYLGVLEFEVTRERFTPEDKKKDPKFYAAFFVSDKKQPLWNTSVEEAEILLREPKRLRIDIFNTILERARATKTTPKRDSATLNRSNSDVSLSETLYDSLFSVNDNKSNDTDKSKKKLRNPSVDVSEVVTACLDNMAAKTGMTRIKRQSHMDRWLQKAKCNTPEKSKTKTQYVVRRTEKNKVKKKSKDVSAPHAKRNESHDKSENMSYQSENSNHSSIVLVDNEKNSIIFVDSDSNANSDSDSLVSKRLKNGTDYIYKTETDSIMTKDSKNNEKDVISSVSDYTIGSTNIELENQIQDRGFINDVLKETDLNEISNDQGNASHVNDDTTESKITESEIQNEVIDKSVDKEVISLNRYDTQTTDNIILRDPCNNMEVEDNLNSNYVDAHLDVLESDCTPQTTNCGTANTSDTISNLNDNTVIDESLTFNNIDENSMTYTQEKSLVSDDTTESEAKSNNTVIEDGSTVNHSEENNVCFSEDVIPTVSDNMSFERFTTVDGKEIPPSNKDAVIEDSVSIRDITAQISDNNDVESMDADESLINADITENQTNNKNIMMDDSLSINNTDENSMTYSQDNEKDSTEDIANFDNKENSYKDGMIIDDKSNVENVEDSMTQDQNAIFQDSFLGKTVSLVSSSNQENRENYKNKSIHDKIISENNNEGNTICIPDTMTNLGLINNVEITNNIKENIIDPKYTENQANGNDKAIKHKLNYENMGDGPTYSQDTVGNIGGHFMVSENTKNQQTSNEDNISEVSDGNSQDTEEDDISKTESLIEDCSNERESKTKRNEIKDCEEGATKNVENYNKKYNAYEENITETQGVLDTPNRYTNAKNIKNSAISNNIEINNDLPSQKILKNFVAEDNAEKKSLANEKQVTENANITLCDDMTNGDLNVINIKVQNDVPIKKLDDDLTRQQGAISNNYDISKTINKMNSQEVVKVTQNENNTVLDKTNMSNCFVLLSNDVIRLKGGESSTTESLKRDQYEPSMEIANGLIKENRDVKSLDNINDCKAVIKLDEKSEIIENGFIENKESSLERVIKEELDFETASINSEDSVTTTSKRKFRTKSDKVLNGDKYSEKVNVTKALEDPEFVNYLEFKQDALLEENPELTQEEIVTYLYKTWLYEESKKSDLKKTDEIEQSSLVKGLNKDAAPPKKVRKKAKVEKVVTVEKVDSEPALEETSKEKPKRRIVKALYNEDIFDFEDEIKLFEIFNKKSKLKEAVKNSESKGESKVFEITEDDNDELSYAEEEIYFEQLTQPKPNLFKGLVREKVCEICEAPSDLVKCKGCHCMFHVACVKKELEKVDAPIPAKGRKKKKKPRGRRPKDGNSLDSEGHSDEKSQDANVSDDLNMSIDDIEPESHIVVDADTLEAQLSAKMKELLENAENIDYDSNYDGELNWSNSIAGKCEIVDVKMSIKIPVTSEYYSDFKCNNCQKYDTPICFVCRSNLSPKNRIGFRQKCQVAHCLRYYHLECLDHWPQTQFSSGVPSKNNKKLNEHFEAISCPRHVCHTCVCDDPRGCKTRFSGDKLARCVKCPATYHSFTKCLPAGTQILTGSHIICPRHYGHRPGKVPCHVNTGWCFICAQGGTLICCEYCPTSFHAECLNIKPPEGGYMCEDCETGRLPLYGEMVWVKLGHYRWWPGIVLHPSEIPVNILAVKHSLGEFVVRFFGQYDHYWVNRGRVFPFQEGDSGRISSQKSKIDEAFTLAMEHAQRAFEILKTLDANNEEASEINSSLLPPHYVKLKVNKPCGAISIRRDDEAESLTQCDCDPDLEEPCGPHSQCLNRMLLTECGPSCRAGDRCNNRAFEKRLYPKLEPYRTPHRGWGLRTLEDIKQGQFVIEYVGELIDVDEFQRRMRRKHEQRDENFYFLTLDKERMIDAGPKGNLARFMNHCCEPNCETQKWTVLGDIHVGLFALYDIPANSEVTFNYNLESAGIEKKRCLCGAKRCSGYIGAKPKQEEIPKKIKRTYKKRKMAEVSPSTTKSKPKPRSARIKPKELTEIEKDLLIINNATNGISSDSETSSRLSSIESDKVFKEKMALKRKRVDFSTEEVIHYNGGDSPSVKRAKIDEKDAVGD